MTLLDDSERQDFWTTIAEAGLSKEDFNLKEVEEEPKNVGINAITGIVIVERKSTGVSRQYAAGHATSWLAAFEAELCGGVFDAGAAR